MSDREDSPRDRKPSLEHRDRDDARRRRSSRSPIRGKSRSRSRSVDRDRRKRRTRSRSGSYGRGRDRSRDRTPPRRRSRSPLSSRKRHEVPDPSRVLGVFGLSLYTTERELYNIFHKFGQVEKITVVLDAQSGRSRGFAFVYYENVDDARAAKEECSGMDIDGRKIRVDYSITQRAHTPTPGVYMGRPSGGRRRYAPEKDRYERRSRSPYSRRSRSPYSRRRDGGGGGGGYYDRYERSRSRSYSPPSRKYGSSRRGYY